MKKILLLSSLIMTILSCNNDPDNSGRILSEKEKSELQKVKVLTKEEGLLKLQINCLN